MGADNGGLEGTEDGGAEGTDDGGGKGGGRYWKFGVEEDGSGEDGDVGGRSSGGFFFRRVGGSGWITGATPVSFARLRVNIPITGRVRIQK